MICSSPQNVDEFGSFRLLENFPKQIKYLDTCFKSPDYPVQGTVLCLSDSGWYVLYNVIATFYPFPSATLLSPQDMCSSFTRGFVEGYITTPEFPSPPPDQLYDCTCQLRPNMPSASGMTITVIVMHVRLAEPEDCAEETWVEDQVRWC